MRFNSSIKVEFYRIFVLAFFLIGISLSVSGCATLNPDTVINNFEKTKIYPPIRLTENTELSLKKLTSHVNMCDNFSFGGGADDFQPSIITEGIRHVLSRRFVQSGEETENNLVMLLDARVKLGMFSGTTTSLDLTGTFIDGSQTIDVINGHGQAIVPWPASNVGFQKAAEAAFVQFDGNLKRSERLKNYFDVIFEQKAKAWRAMPQKPPLPEEVHRLIVLKDDAIQNNDFSKAADYYEQALAIDPMWPAGQYNAAMIYSELGSYPMAVTHMKHYLALEPAAANARASQDKIYIWEEKAKGGQ